jgi:hypothetical protein
MARFKKKGMILFVVLGVILVVGVLAIVVLRLISSHARLTHHQVTRIQAQYAAKAGIIYALDRLRRNDDVCWGTTGSYDITMRRATAGACVVLEPYLPASIDHITIHVSEPGTGIMGTRQISATADFTYTPD